MIDHLEKVRCMLSNLSCTNLPWVCSIDYSKTPDLQQFYKENAKTTMQAVNSSFLANFYSNCTHHTYLGNGYISLDHLADNHGMFFRHMIDLA